MIPSFVILVYIYRKDLNREPMREVIRTFVLGVLLIIPVLIFASLIRDTVVAIEQPYLNGFLSSLLLAAIPEESFKFMLLILFCMRRAAFDEEMDGLVYGATASLGFATLENVLYVLKSGFGVAVLRAVTSVPSHASLGVIMGYYLVQWRSTQKSVFFWMALFVPIALHTGYDFPLMTGRNLTKIAANNPSVSILLIMLFVGCITVEFWYAKKVLNLVSRRQVLAPAIEKEPT